MSVQRITVVYNGTEMRMKIRPLMTQNAIETAIRTRFKLNPKVQLMLLDSDGDIAPIDQTLVTDNYVLEATDPDQPQGVKETKPDSIPVKSPVKEQDQLQEVKETKPDSIPVKLPVKEQDQLQEVKETKPDSIPVKSPVKEQDQLSEIKETKPDSIPVKSPVKEQDQLQEVKETKPDSIPVKSPVKEQDQLQEIKETKNEINITYFVEKSIKNKGKSNQDATFILDQDMQDSDIVSQIKKEFDLADESHLFMWNDKHLAVEITGSLPSGNYSLFIRTTRTTEATKVLAKKERLRRQAIDELVQSEERYVNFLETMNTEYAIPMKEHKWKSDKLDANDARTLFGNLESLLMLNKLLLKEMKRIVSEESNNTMEQKTFYLAAIFCQNAPLFKMYTSHVSQYADASAYLAKLLHPQSKYASFRKDCLKNAMPLPNLLSMPNQRVPRYRLCLLTIQKNCQRIEPGYLEMGKALELVSTVAMKVEDAIKMSQTNTLLFKLGLFDLIDNRRTVLHEGDLLLFTRNKQNPTIDTHVYLFSDTLLYGNWSTGKFVETKRCTATLPTQNVSVRKLPPSSHEYIKRYQFCCTGSDQGKQTKRKRRKRWTLNDKTMVRLINEYKKKVKKNKDNSSPLSSRNMREQYVIVMVNENGRALDIENEPQVDGKGRWRVGYAVIKSPNYFQIYAEKDAASNPLTCLVYDRSLELTSESDDKWAVPNAFTIRAAVNNNLGWQKIVISTGPGEIGKAARQDWMASFKMCATDPSLVTITYGMNQNLKNSMKLSFSSGTNPMLESDQKEEHSHHLFQIVITGGAQGSVKHVFEAPSENSMLMWVQKMNQFKKEIKKIGTTNTTNKTITQTIPPVTTSEVNSNSFSQNEGRKERGNSIIGKMRSLNVTKKKNHKKNSDSSSGAVSKDHWIDDSEHKTCNECSQAFSLTIRRHHCRRCGKLVCGNCSKHKDIVAGVDNGKPVRVCNICHLANTR